MSKKTEKTTEPIIIFQWNDTEVGYGYISGEDVLGMFDILRDKDYEHAQWVATSWVHRAVRLLKDQAGRPLWDYPNLLCGLPIYYAPTFGSPGFLRLELRR